MLPAQDMISSVHYYFKAHYILAELSFNEIILANSIFESLFWSQYRFYYQATTNQQINTSFVLYYRVIKQFFGSKSTKQGHLNFLCFYGKCKQI